MIRERHTIYNILLDSFYNWVILLIIFHEIGVTASRKITLIHVHAKWPFVVIVARVSELDDVPFVQFLKFSEFPRLSTIYQVIGNSQLFQDLTQINFLRKSIISFFEYFKSSEGS